MGIGIILIFINSIPFLQSFQAIEKGSRHETVQLNSQLNITGLDKIHQVYSKKLKKGEKIGELTIPRLNETYPIYEGTSSDILKKGVGHYSRSALPGEANNSILSGHRDTFFKGLEELKKFDELIVKTNAGSFLYKIKKIRIVDDEDQTVITPKPKATLTVTTCYPFYFIGNAPKRYILVADLITSNLSH